MQMETSASSLAAVKRAIRQQTFSINNRLRSIFRDINYTRRVTDHLRRNVLPIDTPIYVNLRAGAWYYADVQPATLADTTTSHGAGTTKSCITQKTVHFKSSDGHPQISSFSVSRLNLHLLKQLSTGGSAIIIDVTRSGKTFPDALVRTIPIWLTVICTIQFGGHPREHLQLPPWFPEQERYFLGEDTIPKLITELPAATVALIREYPLSAIPKLVWLPASSSVMGEESWYEMPCSVCGSTDGIAHDDAAFCFRHPMRAAACAPGADDGEAPCAVACASEAGEICDHVASVPHLVCISASRYVEKTDLIAAQHGWHYIQGAGDDEENWAEGRAAMSVLRALHETFSECVTADFFDTVWTNSASFPREIAANTATAVVKTQSCELHLRRSCADASNAMPYVKLLALTASEAVELGKYYEKHRSFTPLREDYERGDATVSLEHTILASRHSSGLELRIPADKYAFSRCRQLLSQFSLPIALDSLEAALGRAPEPAHMCCAIDFDEQTSSVAMIVAAALLCRFDAAKYMHAETHSYSKPSLRAAVSRIQAALDMPLPPRDHFIELSRFLNRGFEDKTGDE